MVGTASGIFGSWGRGWEENEYKECECWIDLVRLNTFLTYTHGYIWLHHQSVWFGTILNVVSLALNRPLVLTYGQWLATAKFSVSDGGTEPFRSCIWTVPLFSPPFLSEKLKSRTTRQWSLWMERQESFHLKGLDLEPGQSQRLKGRRVV